MKTPETEYLKGIEGTMSNCINEFVRYAPTREIAEQMEVLCNKVLDILEADHKEESNNNMKAKIKDHFTKTTKQRVYPATSEHARIDESINHVKTENILFDYYTPSWLVDEDYNMIIHFKGRLFTVRSRDFNFTDDPELDGLNRDL